MLKNIGSLSPRLRDNTIYIDWVDLEESNRISLFDGIEDGCSDKVFTRSFASLLLVILIESNFKSRYIDTKTEKEIIKISIEYMETEKDNRGLVDEKGWAHAFAHGADLLETISKSIYLTSDSAKRILSCISRALMSLSYMLKFEDIEFEETQMLITEYLKFFYDTFEIINDFYTYVIFPSF